MFIVNGSYYLISANDQNVNGYSSLLIGSIHRTGQFNKTTEKL